MIHRRNERRVLVFSPGSLGDTVVSLPSFHLIKDAFPKAWITVLTHFPVNSKASPAGTVLENTGLVDDYLEYPHPFRDPRLISRLHASLRSRRYDCLVYLAHHLGSQVSSLRHSLFFLSCGIVKQFGVPYLPRDLHCIPVAGTGRYRSEAERRLGCLRRLGSIDPREDRWWDLRLTEEEVEEADGILEGLGTRTPFFAVSIGTKADVNDWTEGNWSSLIWAMGEYYPGHGLVALGSRDEASRSEAMISRWGGPSLNLCGATRPRVSAAVLRRAQLFVGHDSGPMHLAACVGTGCVAVFSGMNPPGEWFPRGDGHKVLFRETDCTGCRAKECRFGHKTCIMSIHVDKVLDAIKSKVRMNGRPADCPG